MSTKDPHPLLKQIAEQNDGYDEAAHGELDLDAFAAHQAYKSILQPATRMQALNDLDNVIRC
jgi:hypothetical protein